MSSELLPPAQPDFVLRGHAVQIHALHFTSGNTRLLTGDADGWVMSWNLAFKRPVAVWRAHENSILGLGSWGHDRIITYVCLCGPRRTAADIMALLRHGRDNKLIVWRLGPSDEIDLDPKPPIDASALTKKSPWMLYLLTVNTLNFCSFAMCEDGMLQHCHSQTAIEDGHIPKPVLVAVPNTVDSNSV